MEDTNEINAEDITFSQNAQLKALVAKNITVIENICVKFYGIIRGDLILKKGSKMFLHGSLYGNLVNEGGELHLFHTNKKEGF